MKGKMVRFSDDFLITEFGYSAVMRGDIPQWAKQTGEIEYSHRNGSRSTSSWILCGIVWNDGSRSTVNHWNLSDLNGNPII